MEKNGNKKKTGKSYSHVRSGRKGQVTGGLVEVVKTLVEMVIEEYAIEAK